MRLLLFLYNVVFVYFQIYCFPKAFYFLFAAKRIWKWDFGIRWKLWCNNTKSLGVFETIGKICEPKSTKSVEIWVFRKRNLKSKNKLVTARPSCLLIAFEKIKYIIRVTGSYFGKKWTGIYLLPEGLIWDRINLLYGPKQASFGPANASYGHTKTCYGPNQASYRPF